MKTSDYFYSRQGDSLLTYCLTESDIDGRRYGAGILRVRGGEKTQILCLGLTDSMKKAVEFIKAADENCVLPENFSEVAADWFMG